MNILENELVRKYFGVYGNGATMHERVLNAMQEPIRKGERMIWFDYCVDEWKEGIANIDYKPRPDHLRLPDKFQTAGKPKVCQHYVTCESCQSTVDLPQPPPAPEQRAPCKEPMNHDRGCDCNIRPPERGEAALWRAEKEMGLYEDKPANSDQAVEEKIKEIKQWAIHYVCPTGSLDERLRELVDLVRKKQAQMQARLMK